ncbi:MAG TPA: glycosyltransferase family 2 protein [Candidatus Moranbacteria bacterium]|nr:glycosyltransferase family 2 protein [Candidatus Moranbacteria bacterium]
MSENRDQLKEGVIIWPVADYHERFAWKEFFYKTSLVFTGAILVFFVVLLKSKTTSNFSANPLFFSYAIFVTAFAISRIISAMLYRVSFENILSESANLGQMHPEDYEPTVAFVIPCKNEEMNISDAVMRCYQVDYPKEKIEVIVINDGSTDKTLLVLKELKKNYPSLKIVDWENQGKRWAMAAGFKISAAEIIVQLDSDSCVDPKSFRNLIAPFRNKKISAVCAHGEPKNANQNIITRMQSAYYFMSFRILKAAESTFETVFCLSGCCSAYRRSDVMPIIYDWLSEHFLGKPATWGDDRALTSWLLKSGKRTIYNSEAIAYTVVPSSWKQLFTQQLRWKKSWIINAILTSRFIWKKQPFVAFFYYFPLVFISFLAPFITIYALIYAPFLKGSLPLCYIIGVILVTALIAVFYRYVDKKNKFWPYLFLWSLLTLFVFPFIFFWAAVKIQDRGWGTR